jgi:hypothetical protein
MIGITTKHIIANNTFRGAVYTKSTGKHALLFESIGADICILMDRNEFGEFMTKVVESWAEGSRHLIDESIKEITQ